MNRLFFRAISAYLHAVWLTLFGKRAKRDEDKYLDAVAASIEVQIQLGISEDEGDRERLLSNAYCRGYLFGWFESAVLSVGYSSNGEVMALITTGLGRIFDIQAVARLVGISLKEQTDSLFDKARTKAHEEFVEFAKTQKPPRGLALYLSKKAPQPTNFPEIIDIEGGSQMTAWSNRPTATTRTCNRCGKKFAVNSRSRICPYCWPD